MKPGETLVWCSKCLAYVVWFHVCMNIVRKKEAEDTR